MENGNFYIIIGYIMWVYLEEPILQVDALSPEMGAPVLETPARGRALQEQA